MERGPVSHFALYPHLPPDIKLENLPTTNSRSRANRTCGWKSTTISSVNLSRSMAVGEFGSRDARFRLLHDKAHRMASE